jgi:predicted nucleic acid-binding Zn ribbon protein
MTAKKIKKPEQVGSIIDALIARLGLTETLIQHRAMLLWPSVVGNTISKATKPVRVEHGQIYVEVKSSAWRQEIHFHKRSIIENLNIRLKKRVIKDIIFV